VLKRHEGCIDLKRYRVRFILTLHEGSVEDSLELVGVHLKVIASDLLERLAKSLLLGSVLGGNSWSNGLCTYNNTTYGGAITD